MTTAVETDSQTSSGQRNKGSRNVSLERRLTNFLAGRNVPGSDSIHIEAVGGVVVIRGQLPTTAAKRLCLECCWHTAGVMRIVDETRASSDESNAD